MVYNFRIPTELKGKFNDIAFEEHEVSDKLIAIKKKYQNTNNWQVFYEEIKKWEQEYADKQSMPIFWQELGLTMLNEYLLPLESSTPQSNALMAEYTERLIVMKNSHNTILFESLKKLQGVLEKDKLKSLALKLQDNQNKYLSLLGQVMRENDKEPLSKMKKFTNQVSNIQTRQSSLRAELAGFIQSL